MNGEKNLMVDKVERLMRTKKMALWKASHELGYDSGFMCNLHELDLHSSQVPGVWLALPGSLELS